ncbi:hypothetical protein NKR23_g12343 [Pleurostoma richardsiae]|uniref:Ferric oxidoreductase domain-containing protein n=1 Tax=Pleurostoma richardsiae TaxID=41990 RepID=A0AA38R872_9PEZI|nr:hypothetical protein NKR23_g12343 [Pleurostoma richardsiae]
MDVIGLYSILLGGLLALYPARLLTSRLLRCVWPHLRAPFARFLLYRLLTPQWPSIGVTWLELLVFLSFLAANAYPLVMCAVRGGSLGVLGNTAAMMAVMNATPLFLGGRTNPLVDRIGIARHTYYLAHHWIGRVVVVEGLLHAGLALTDRAAAFSVKTSGYVAAGGLLAICVTSLAFSRTYLRTLFPKIHAVLFLAVLAATLSHVIFTLTALYRLLRLSFAAGKATVYNKWEDSQVTRIGLRSGRLCVFPRSYFYVHLPRKATAFSPESALHYEVLTSYPMAVMHYTQAPSSDETSLAFLVSHQARSLRGLAFRLGQRLLLEGPYGRDLSLHLFDRVILTAKGIGIASVLPHAFGLAEHKQHNNEVKAKIFAKAYSTKTAKKASANSSLSGMATRHESLGPNAGSDAGNSIANKTQGRSP